jgi:hypothetical protein
MELVHASALGPVLKLNCRDIAPRGRGVKAAFGREMSIAGPAGFVMMPPA